MALCRQITIVTHIKNTIRFSVKLYFTEVERFCAQLNVEALSLTAAREVKFVTTLCVDFVVTARDNFRDARSVSYNNCACGTGGQVAVKVT